MTANYDRWLLNIPEPEQMTDAEEIAEIEAEEAALDAICSSCGEDEPVWFEGKDRLCAACKEVRDFESEAA